jgi:outer membrane protein assembly factor BamE (lipoprotein component of BamABCDE complex)
MGAMNRAFPCLTALVACLAPSCFISRSTVNESLSRQALERLVLGQTTAKEVVETLGAPAEVVQLGNRTAYRYDFTVRKSAGFSIIILTFLNDDTCSDRAWLFFDSKDVLTHAGSTLQAADTRFEMPWQTPHKG